MGDRVLQIESWEAYLRGAVRNECYSSLRERLRQDEASAGLLEPITPQADPAEQLTLETMPR